MIEEKIQIKNIMGVHARPAARIVKLASKYPCNIEIIKDNMKVNGKSILGVMSLAAEKGSIITIRASGENDEEAVAKIVELLNQIFNEEENQK